MVALASFHKGIQVGHVEAGLRTYNKKSPFPEELNRQLTGRIADLHFAPTAASKENLLSEKVALSSIVVTGNTVTDALEYAVSKVMGNFKNDTIASLKEWVHPQKKLILVTGHRRESFGQGFKDFCDALIEIAQDKTVQLIYPVHLNPNVQEVVYAALSTTSNIHLIAPLEYPSFVWLMNQASVIISDSGGIQEEAPSLHIPVVVTRDTTERQEGIDAGVSFLVGTNKQAIVKKTLEILNDLDSFKDMKNPYGDGTAAAQIVAYLSNKMND
jgi:UDP-N-acetylglucosamine 2-epimerase (non-hydrolysing)